MEAVMRKKSDLCIVITCCFSFLVLLSIANAESGIAFGVKPEKRMISKKENISDCKEIATVRLENGYALLYEDIKALILYLSVFRGGEEKILWQGKDLGATSVQVDRPILATMKIDSNDLLDLIFIYSTNLGIGSTSEAWERDLLIFYDAESTKKHIKLSSADVNISVRGEVVKYSDSKGTKPAYTIRREVFLKPFQLNAENIFYLWSRKDEGGGPENIEARIIEKMMVYGADRKRSGINKTIEDKEKIKTTREKMNKEGWIKLE